MTSETLVATAGRLRRPFYPRIIPFAFASFIGALLTDIVYARSADMMWSNFSAWLLAAGLVIGAVAAIAGLVDIFGGRLTRGDTPHLVGTVLVLVLALFDSFIHSHDAWTSVVPTGLTLTVIVVVVALITAWLGCRRPVVGAAE